MIDLVKLGFGEIRLVGEELYCPAGNIVPVLLPLQENGTFEGTVRILGEEYKIVMEKIDK